MKKSLFANTLLLFLMLLGYHFTSFAQPKASSDIEFLINGKVWVPSYSILKGEQFFLEKMDLNGSLLFKGTNFRNHNFSYDLLKNEIITTVRPQGLPERTIVINPHFLDGFTVTDNKQIYTFRKGNLIHPSLPPENYYQIFKTKTLTYIILRQKQKILSSSKHKSYKYIKNNQLFMIHEGELHRVSNKKDLWKYFPNRKKKIKRYIREKKLKIGSKTPIDVIPVISNFDQ